MIVTYKNWKRHKTFKDLFLKNLDDIEIILLLYSDIDRDFLYKNSFDPMFNEEPMTKFLRKEHIILQAY